MIGVVDSPNVDELLGLALVEVEVYLFAKTGITFGILCLGLILLVVVLKDLLSTE